MADQHGAPALLRLHGVAHLGEDSPERVLFRQRRSQRMPRVDAVHRERGGFEIRAFEGPYMIGVRLATMQPSVGSELDQHCRDFQQRIRGAIETAGFHVDDHRQKGAKAPLHLWCAGITAAVGWRQELVHHGTSCQATASPARIGTSLSPEPLAGNG